MSSEFPVEVRQFIAESIESLAQLEVLLLLQRHADQTWTGDEVAKSLYIAPEMSASLLADLVHQNLATHASSGFRYAATAKVHPIIVLLAQAYQERRVSVVSEIYSKSRSKIQTFADSFRLKKEQ
jgi:hypothetical protein